MKCRNDDNQILAKGLCRACYDTTPERRAKRLIYTKYLNSVGGKATRKRVPLGVSRENKTAYMRAWRANNPGRQNAINRKAYQTRKKRGELLHDSKTPSQRNTRPNDSQIPEGLQRHSNRSERTPIPL